MTVREVGNRWRLQYEAAKSQGDHAEQRRILAVWNEELKTATPDQPQAHTGDGESLELVVSRIAAHWQKRFGRHEQTARGQHTQKMRVK